MNMKGGICKCLATVRSEHLAVTQANVVYFISCTLAKHLMPIL